MPKEMKSKSILFICVENSCRSQMAEGLFNRLSKTHKAISAGTMPAKEVNPLAVEVMKEIGIDIGKNKPKELTLEMFEKADRVITMGCGAEVCPANIYQVEMEDWEIEDPSGKPIDKFRKVRDEIKKRVEKLVAEMG